MMNTRRCFALHLAVLLMGVVMCGSYQPYDTPSFLPAPAGQRPACAGPTDSYCDYIEYYPTDHIKYLLGRYNYDFSSLLLDESRENFFANDTLKKPYSAGTVYIPGQPYPNYSNNNFSGYNIEHIPQQSGYENGPYYNYISNQHSGTYQPRNNGHSWSAKYTAGRSPQSVQTSYRVTRQVNSNSENTLCPTTSQFTTPKAAVNTKGNWMYVVNLENDNTIQATQLVRTERCSTTQCSGLCTVPQGFTATCQQQFVQKRLVALNANGESLYTDTFWFPHCCICQVRPNN